MNLLVGLVDQSSGVVVRVGSQRTKSSGWWLFIIITVFIVFNSNDSENFLIVAKVALTVYERETYVAESFFSVVISDR